MAQSPNLAGFQPNDRFLRRVGLPGQIKRGLVLPRAFKVKDPTLSLTFQDESLGNEVAIDKYRAYWAQFCDGNLPGLIWLSFAGLTTRIDPPLPPRWDRDTDSDPVYGHLHSVIDAPIKEQMELLAKLVNDGQFAGLLRDFVKLDAA